MSTVLYLHGFLSSPRSEKVRILREALEKRAPSVQLIAPDMNYPPRCVDALLAEIAERLALSRCAVVGSSLGGFFATRFAARFGVPCVLLNPCLDPWRFIPDFVGEQRVWGSEQVLEVKASFEEDFRALARATPPVLKAGARSLSLISLRDEVLPWRQTYDAVSWSRRVLLTDEDHRISGFAQWVDLVVDFLLNSTSGTEADEC